jgi:hypothetical protein
MSIPGGAIGQVLFILLAIYGLYQIYLWAFSTQGLQGVTLLNGILDANPSTPYTFDAKGSSLDTKQGSKTQPIPDLLEGGEYTVNFWVYVNSFTPGANKHILQIGGDNFATLVVFLGGYRNSLGVRVHTRDVTVPGAGPSGNAAAVAGVSDLSRGTLDSMFTAYSSSSILNDEQPCDVSNIELQKWIQVTVVLSNKTSDVYIDGKLARSCVLPSFFKVDKQNLKVSLTDRRGFGGFVSNMTAYNYALNPEQVWRLYMTGPGPQYSIWQYVKSLVNPSAVSDIHYPKKNLIA